MAVGIIECGSYVPWHRLGPGTSGWKGSTERSVANFDEDSITMAVAATNNCLYEEVDRQAIDALYFASTTSPYKEKSSAVLVATACDLKTEIMCADFSGSLRAGTIALKAALDAAKADSGKRIVVTASDIRVGKPMSEFDRTLGDGATTFLVGNSQVIAEIEDYYSLSQEIYDTWRSNEDKYVQTWEDRWVFEEGYFKILPTAVSQLMKRNSLKPRDFERAVFYGPNARRHAEMGRRLGFESQIQIQDPLFGKLGDTGSAFSLMMLEVALYDSKAGDRILLANYGSGADAFIWRVTDEITKFKQKKRRGVMTYLQSKKIIDSYQTYYHWRGLLDVEMGSRRPSPLVPSPSAMLREVNKNIRFYGSKCKRCASLQYPPQRICTRCHSKDEFEYYPFWNKKAKVFTFAKDYLTPTLDPPLVLAVANFEGGGRALLETTDRDVNQYKIGQYVEMTFRKLYTAAGIHNYYWKCTPVK